MAPRESSRAGPQGQETPAVTSSFLLGNLHCPSCVSSIRDVLQEACAGHIRWVSPNIVTSVVTVEHDPAATLERMTAALVDAGFEICGVTSSTGESFLDLDGIPQHVTGVLSSAAGLDIPAGAPATSTTEASPLSYGKSGAVHTKQQANIHDMTDGPSSSSSSSSPPPSMPGPYWGLSPLSRWLFLPPNSPNEKAVPASQERILQAHLDNCEQCRLQKKKKPATGKQKEKEQAEQTHGKKFPEDAQQNTRVSSTAPHPLNTASSTAISTGIDIGRGAYQQKSSGSGGGGRKTVVTTAAAMADTSFVAVETEDAPIYRPTWRVNLAVGGMTCAVCVNTITDELRKRDWVIRVAVNLISNSATVEVDDESRVAQVIEAIEDLGYDAALDSVTCIHPPQAPRPHQHNDDAASTASTADGRLSSEEGARRRTIDILIGGLYCEHCPDRIVGCLAGFRRPSLEILTKPTPQHPVLQLSYIPDAPTFTIRHILAAIEACDAALSASIYHPPTLEERSRLIRAKHQRQILYRVLLTGLTCIPTFIIGIVYMTLLPSMDHGRMFLMQPWTSGINRAQIAMFIMATPVYFLAADIFHVRAFKEIRTLWRRGSRTPLLQRFYRFGSMNTLISLGTTIAYVSSVSQMIAAAAHQASEINDANFYFDSVVFLTFFLLLGRLIEAYSKSKTGDAVEMLGRLRPTTAILVAAAPEGEEKAGMVYTHSYNSSASLVGPATDVVSGTVSGAISGTVTGTEVSADLLEFGDVVRVLHGASPPADGVVVQGQSSFDESSLTGESRLVAKTAGDAVFSGTVNKDGPVLVRISGTSGASMLDQIVAVVREGQTKRAPMEQIADLLTTYFVPVVTLVAILTWLTWLSLGLSGRIPSHYLDVGSGGWVAFSLQFAIAVFVVACPCGLGLAAPTAIFVAGGMAAKSGILAKGGGEAFEKASRIDCVVFDKTGTLTMGGEPTVTDAEIVDTAGNAGRADLLAALRAVEENSSHPIAKAVVSYCDGNQVAAGARVDDIREMAGRGMRATYHGRNDKNDEKGASFEMIVGNEALMADFHVAVTPSMAARLQQWKSDAKSVALAATRPAGGAEGDRPWTLAVGLAVSDPVRPEAAPILAALQARGILVYMLSGDNAVTAAAVARQLGIPEDQVIAEVLPTEKAAKIQALQASLPARTSRFGRVLKGKKASAAQTSSSASASTHRATVAMVGDGINDSPALTQADVGIAVGSGSDVAISSADFVLVQSNLQAVVTLLELSRAVFRRIAFNFGWALIYNVLAVPIAAGVLYPIRTATTDHIRLDPVWASLAMAMSSISVVLSSLALRSRIPGIGFRPTAVNVPAN